MPPACNARGRGTSGRRRPPYIARRPIAALAPRRAPAQIPAREGTVIRSWLLDLLVAALYEDDDLAKIAGYAEDSGEGRWTVEAGIDNAVATPAITAALYARFVSRQDDSPAMKAVATGGLAEMIAPGSRVLAIGCGDGMLIDSPEAVCAR